MNQCYQLLAGSKLITEFDENWSNVVDVVKDRLSLLYEEIKDIRATTADATQVLQKKVDELNTIKTDLANSGFRPDWVTQQTTALDGVINKTSCFINSANSRSTNSCSESDVVTGVNNAENIQNSSTICAEFGEIFDLEGEYIETFSGGVFPQIIIKTNDGKYMTINKYVPPLSKSYVIAKIFMKYFDELNLSREKLKNQSISIQHGSTRGYNYPNDVGVRNPIDSYWWSLLEHKMIIVQLPNNHEG